VFVPSLVGAAALRPRRYFLRLWRRRLRILRYLCLRIFARFAFLPFMLLRCSPWLSVADPALT